MSKFSTFLSANGALLGGVAIAGGVAVIALIASGVLKSPEDPSTTVVADAVPATVPAVEEPATPSAPNEDASAVQAAETDDTATPEPDADVAVAADQVAVADVAPEVADPVVEPAVPAPVLPAFDVVRVDAEGNAVLAGTAASNAQLEILVDGSSVHETSADGAGKFAALLTLGTSDQPRMLGLVQRLDTGDLFAAADVIIAPVFAAPVVVAEADVAQPEATPEAVQTDQIVEGAADVAPGETVIASADPVAETAEAALAEAAPIVPQPSVDDKQSIIVEEGASAKENTLDVASVSEPEAVEQTAQAPASPEPSTSEPVASAPSTTEPAAAAPAAPAILVSDADGVRVVQPAIAADATDETLAAIAIDAISYSDDGDVEVAGRGTPEHFARLYLDNVLLVTAPISDEGDWAAELGGVTPGVYTLRVDEVDAEGVVTSRLETPFKREEPALVAEAQEEADEAAAESGEIVPPVRVVTVQPGFTLWAIARESYGEGLMYVRVYEANQDKIRDPDLIYPGQVFTVPE